MGNNEKNNEKYNDDGSRRCLTCSREEPRNRDRSSPPANKKARRWSAAGGIHTNPRLGFMPSHILCASASERIKRSRYSRRTIGRRIGRACDSGFVLRFFSI